jgi:hypothetical protein
MSSVHSSFSPQSGALLRFERSATCSASGPATWPRAGIPLYGGGMTPVRSRRNGFGCRDLNGRSRRSGRSFQSLDAPEHGFSNHWKFSHHFFQSLETFWRRFSNRWKSALCFVAGWPEGRFGKGISTQRARRAQSSFCMWRRGALTASVASLGIDPVLVERRIAPF